MVAGPTRGLAHDTEASVSAFRFDGGRLTTMGGRLLLGPLPSYPGLADRDLEREDLVLARITSGWGTPAPEAQLYSAPSSSALALYVGVGAHESINKVSLLMIQYGPCECG